jgi:glutathione-regulated potassium-efflux system ancillary protein KefF
MKTLVIVSHPYKDRSNVIKALEQTVLGLPDVIVRNLESLYGNDSNHIDVAAEQLACHGVDRIVFMFPIHWFNLTPMLKSYLNEVWAYGWAFGPDGAALRDKEMLVVTSAGARENTYSAQGIIQSTIEDVLTPIKASALYVGMKYAKPLVLFEAMDATAEKLDQFKDKLIERIIAV